MVQGDIVTVFGNKVPVHAISGVETRAFRVAWHGMLKIQLRKTEVCEFSLEWKFICKLSEFPMTLFSFSIVS
jgi:hypothetical protein